MLSVFLFTIINNGEFFCAKYLIAKSDWIMQTEIQDVFILKSNGKKPVF